MKVNKLTLTFLAVVAVLIFSMQAFAAVTFDDLIKDSGYAVQKQSNGSYRVFVEGKQGTTTLVVFQEALGDSDIKLLEIYSYLGDLPKGSELSPAIAKSIVQMSGNMELGKIICMKLKDGTTALMYQAAFQLSDVTKDGLAIDLEVAALYTQSAKKQLTPLLNGE